MMLKHIPKRKDTMLTKTFRGKVMERGPMGPSSWRNNEEELFSASLKQVGTVQLLNSAQLSSQRYETESERLFSSRCSSRLQCTSLLVSILRRPRCVQLAYLFGESAILLLRDDDSYPYTFEWRTQHEPYST